MTGDGSTTSSRDASDESAGDAASRAIAVWRHLLDGYAAALDQHRQLLLSAHADGFEPGQDVLPPAFVPPPDVPACPPELLGRVAALLAETEGLVTLADDVLTRFPVLTGGRRPGAGSFATPAAAMVDARL